jgi:hypothetical protein
MARSRHDTAFRVAMAAFESRTDLSVPIWLPALLQASNPAEPVTVSYRVSQARRSLSSKWNGSDGRKCTLEKFGWRGFKR